MDISGLWITVPVGILLGILTGLGVGGGSLLLLWLTLGAGMDPGKARIVSLLFFIPAALVSGFFQKNSIPWKALIPGILSGIAAAALFSWLGTRLDPARFQKGLGVLLVITGIRELFQKHKK